MTARKTCDKGECCRQDMQGQLRASLSREAALREALDLARIDLRRARDLFAAMANEQEAMTINDLIRRRINPLLEPAA